MADVNVRFTANTSEAQSAIQSLASSVSSSFQAINSSLNDIKSSTSSVDSSLKQLASSTKSSTDSMKSSIDSLHTIVKAAFATMIAWGALKFAKGFLETAAEFERMGVALETITGSSGKAKKAMDWITAFTAKTPYELKEVTQGFTLLSAQGLDATKNMQMLGDAASAMGKPLKQAVEMFVDAVRGENERLKEFGVTAHKEGEKITYKWSENGRNMTLSAKNNAESITEALMTIFKRFEGGMDKQSQTWNGMVSNMKDAWTLFQRDVMDTGPFEVMKEAIRGILKEIENLKKNGRLDQWAKDMALFVVEAFGIMANAASIFLKVLNSVRAAMIWNSNKFSEATFNAYKGESDSLISKIEGKDTWSKIFGGPDDETKTKLKARLKEVTNEMQKASDEMAANAQSMEASVKLDEYLTSGTEALVNKINKIKTDIGSSAGKSGSTGTWEDEDAKPPAQTGWTSDSGAAKSRIEELKKLLDEEKDQYILAGKLKEWDLAKEKEYWQSKLATAGTNIDLYKGINHQIAEVMEKQSKESEKNNRKSEGEAKRAAAEEKRQLNERYQNLKADFQRDVETHKKSGEEKIRLAQEFARRTAEVYGKDSVKHKEALTLVERYTQEHNANMRQLAEQAIELEQTRAMGVLSIEEENINFQQQMGNISVQQQVTALQNLENRKYQIALQGLQQRLALEGQDLSKRAAINTQIEQAGQQHALKMEQLEHQAALDTANYWKQAFDGIANAFKTSIKGLIAGTMTWKQALQNLAKGILDTFIDMTFQMVAKWLWKETMQTVLTGLGVSQRTAVEMTGATVTGAGEAVGVTKHVVAETAKTGATVTGVTTRTAAETTAQGTGLMMTAFSAIKTIGMKAYEAAAGAYAAIAGIPYVGPFLAPAIAAGALVAVLAFSGAISAAGGAELETDKIVSAHAKEVVLPAAWTTRLKSLTDTYQNSNNPAAQATSQSPPSVNNVNISITAMDSQDVERAFNSNSGALFKIVNQGIRNGKFGAKSMQLGARR